MKPDDEYNKKCQEKEKVKLEEKLKVLTPEQKQDVFKTGQFLLLLLLLKYDE